MSKPKTFTYGDRVTVVAPGYPVFTGTVYSQEAPRQGRERSIYVQKPSGAGVAFLVRYVNHAKPKRNRGVCEWLGHKLVTPGGKIVAEIQPLVYETTWEYKTAKADLSFHGRSTSEAGARSALTKIATCQGYRVEQPG